MLRDILLIQMLFLPLIYGGNDTVQLTKKVLNVTLHDIASNITKIVLVTEGGAITDINSNLTLHNDNNTNLMDLENELSTPKNRSIVPRKGVKSDEFIDTEHTAVKTTDIKDHGSSDIKVDNTYKMKSNTKLSNNTRITSPIAGDHADNLPKPVLPHKPSVLVYEELSGLKHETQAVPSSKTIVSDQIPNPNLVNVKIKPVESSQPDMLMPVVITILTVPLLIALGYLALNRGREAWKNRHYKRMDFLLDGMYND